MRSMHSNHKVDHIMQAILGIVLFIVAIAISVIILSHLHEFARMAAVAVTASIVITDMVVVTVFVAAILGRLPDNYIEEDNIDAHKKS